MKDSIKFFSVMLVSFISIITANALNSSFDKAQANIVTAYNRKQTEARTFKTVEDANKFIFDKGTKIESIAKDLGIDYIMSDDKGVFYHSDASLNNTNENRIPDDSATIKWGAGVAEYGTNTSKNGVTYLYQDLYMSTKTNVANIEDYRDNIVVKFLYDYLVKVENKNITYDKLLKDINNTYKKYCVDYPDKGVSLHLTDDTFILINDSTSLQVKMSHKYKKRMVKQGKTDFEDFFITCKNSKEVKDRLMAVYQKHDKLNEDAGNYEYRGLYSSIDYKGAPYWISEPSVDKLDYNTKLYPNINKDNEIYSINMDVSTNIDYYDVYNVYNLKNIKKFAEEEGNLLYDFVQNEIYNGSYKLSRSEFVSKFVKNELIGSLEFMYYNTGVSQITPGIFVNDFYINVPLKFK